MILKYYYQFNVVNPLTFNDDINVTHTFLVKINVIESCTALCCSGVND